MDRLIKRRLLNDGLVKLTPHLADRYRKSLLSLGIMPPHSDHVSIDGAGISPEMADACNNRYYLANGEMNPVAVIVSPEQYNRPVFFPIFSWQRALMRAFFEKYHREIYDVTGTHVISLELENGLSRITSPLDLLLLSEITAVPHIEEITEASARQMALIEEFNQGQRCLDEDICDEIIKSREQFGDLRKRRTGMQPLAFDSFTDFYSAVCGGVAVLRNVDAYDLLVLEDEAQFAAIQKQRRKGVRIYYLHDADNRVFATLAKANWIGVPFERYQSEPKLLDYKKELLLADSLCDAEVGIAWRKLTNSARKSLMQKHDDRVPAIYFELERFAASVKRGDFSFEMTPELTLFLTEPSPNLPPATQEVLWILLTRKEPRNLLSLYTVDKNEFLRRYETWSDARREWAAGYLEERYRQRFRSLPVRGVLA